VLQALAPALELTVERSGRVVTLRPAGRALVPSAEMPRRVEAGA
jgi:hypothetical protein